MKRSIAEVRDKYSNWLMSIENVNGVAIHQYGNGREFLTVYVKKMTPNVNKEVPKKLEGYNVEVDEIGEISVE